MKYDNKTKKVTAESSDVKLRGPVVAATSEGIVASAQQVKDLEYNVTQGEINTELKNHIADTDNPHKVTKDQVGLGNVQDIDQSKAVSSIVRKGDVFTVSHLDGTTSEFNWQTEIVDAHIDAAINKHNADETAHSDIRELIDSTDKKLTKVADDAHNTLQTAIEQVNNNIATSIEAHNSSSESHADLRSAIKELQDSEGLSVYVAIKEDVDQLKKDVSTNTDSISANSTSISDEVSRATAKENSIVNTSLTLKINGTTQTTYKPDGNNQEFNVTLAGLGGATSGHNHNIENLTNFSQRVYDATVSRTAGTVLAAPASANGAATFRKLVKSDIPALDYLTSSSLSGYATETWVNNKNYLTSSNLSGYATETWVTNKGYLTSSSLNGYATQDWVTSQSYATQTWVSSQGFLTSHQSLDGYLKATSYGGYVAPTYGSTQLGFREYPSGSLNHGQANMKGILVGGGSYDSLMFYLGGSTSGIGTVNQVYFSASPFSSGSYGDALIRFRDNSTDTHAHYVSIVADQNPTQAILTVSGGTSCYSIQTTRNIATPAVAETSDARYKVKQDDIYLNIDDIVNAPSMEFKWDRDKDNSLPEGIYYGTTAQYWEDKLPNIVSKTSDDGVLSLNYSKLGVAIGLSLAKEIKELKETVASLKEEIASLKSK